MPDLIAPEHIEYLRQCPQGDAICYALNTLLEHDRDLLAVNANERSITFRFAMYLQSQLPEWTVDCEYNRDGIDPKRIGNLDLDPDSEDEDAKTVFPDVIVHRRGVQNNLLVLEFKKSTSQVSRNVDIRKLRGYRRELNYAYALFVEVGTGDQDGITLLKWV